MVAKANSDISTNSAGSKADLEPKTGLLPTPISVTDTKAYKIGKSFIPTQVGSKTSRDLPSSNSLGKSSPKNGEVRYPSTDTAQKILRSTSGRIIRASIKCVENNPSNPGKESVAPSPQSRHFKRKRRTKFTAIGPSSHTCPIYSDRGIPPDHYVFYPDQEYENVQSIASPQDGYSSFPLNPVAEGSPSPLEQYPYFDSDSYAQQPDFYYTNPPSLLCKKNLPAESLSRLEKLTQKKIFIALKGKSKLQQFPEIIGEVTIKELLSALKENLDKSFPDLVLDIRVAGSGANNLIFGLPSLESLRDVDIVFYLSFIPLESEQISQYLLNISSIFDQTLSAFVSHPLVANDQTLFSIIRNYYLSNHKVVNDEYNKWLLTGTGALDLRFSLQATREYTSSDYSFQVSLLDHNSYCLFGDRESAERDFVERRLVIPRPKEMPNCLGRTLLELNRHDHYSSIDLIPVVENYLESAPPDCFISVLESHLHEEALYKRSFGHIISLLEAIALSNTSFKSEVLQKAILMLERELKIQDASSLFEDKVNGVIKKIVDLEFYSDAFTLSKLFQETNSINVGKSLVYLLEKVKSAELTPAFLDNILALALKEDNEESRLVLMKIIQIAISTKNEELLLKLLQDLKKIPSFLDKKYLDFLVSLLESLSNINNPDLHREAKYLLASIKDRIPIETYLKLSHLLIERSLVLKVLAKDLIFEAANFNTFFEDRTLLNKILDFAAKEPKEVEAETLDLVFILLDKWRKKITFSSITHEEGSKLERFYHKKISRATCIDSIIDEMEDLSSHPVFSQKKELVLSLINRLDPLLPTLHFKNCLKVFNFVSYVIYSPFVEEHLFKDKLKNIIPTLSFVLARASCNDVASHGNSSFLSRSKALFLLAKEHNILSSDEFSSMAMALSQLFLKNGAIKDALNFLFLALPDAKDKREIAKNISSIFFFPNLSHKVRIFRKHEEFLVNNLDTTSLAMIYQTLLQVTKKSSDSNPRKTDERYQLCYLLDKSQLLNLQSEPAFARFLVDFLSSYEPSIDSDIFVNESEILSRLLSGIQNIEYQVFVQFKVKCFRKYLNLSIEKNDPSYRVKAIEIFDNCPNLSLTFAPILLQHLVLLAEKGEDVKNVFFLITKIVPQIKSLPSATYKEELSFILSTYIPKTVDCFSSYLEVLDLLISKEIVVEESVWAIPLEFFRKEIVLSERDKSKKEDALLAYKILQNSIFWKSSILEKEKRDVFFSLVPVFQNSVEKIQVLKELVLKNISESLSKYPERKNNPWLHLTQSNYESLHLTLLSWLNYAETIGNVENVTSFYDILHKYELNNKESFARKMEIFSRIFAIYMDQYKKVQLEEEKEELRVWLLVKVFIAWFKVVERNVKTLKLEEFERASSVLIFNLWQYFTSDKAPSIEYFYKVLKKEGMEERLNSFLKRTCGNNLRQIISPKEEILLPPQAILQAVVLKRFPTMTLANRCFRETYSS